MPCPLTTCTESVQYHQLPLEDYIDDSVETDTSSSVNTPTPSCPSSCRTSCTACCDKKIGHSYKASVRGLIVSVGLLVTTPAICAGLFYYSIFVLEPALVIDKSIHAFTIPNHPASLHYDAFKVASQHNSSQHSILFGRCSNLFSHRHSRSILPESVRVNDAAQTVRYGLKKRTENVFKPVFQKSADILPQYLKESSQLFPSDISDDFHVVSKRSVPEPDSFTISSHLQYHPQWRMQVVFVAEGENDKENIFTKERLEIIHDIEQKIINHPNFMNFCLKDYSLASMDPAVKAQSSCAPLNSLMSFFYPSWDEQSKPHFDGLGKTLVKNISESLRWAFTSQKSYYFVDDKVNKTFHKSQYLRTEVQFGTPLHGFMSPYFDINKQSKKFKSFVITYIDLLSRLSTDKVRVLYGSTDILDYQVDHLFWSDVMLANITLICICVIMLLLTFSLWLTFWGVLSIIICFPVALFLYRFVFGISTLGILNGVGAFIIIGIGVDDVFVFVNIFRQVGGHLTLPQRIKHTMRTAGKATFFTSFTTAAAFAANIFSSIPAVHQFGLFMSLIVCCCWVTVVMVMPPALYIWAVSIYRCEEALAQLLSRIQGRARGVLSAKLCLPADIARFVRGHASDNSTSSPDSQGGASAVDEESSAEDNDVPMLMMEDPMQEYFDAVGDVEMLDGTFLLEDHKQDLLFINVLQGFTYQCIARPVTHVRWAILVTSLVILGVSVSLMVQLTPASRPPQLFRADTDLQMLLDLKSNISMDAISCPQCSAMYSMDAAFNPQHYPAHYRPLPPKLHPPVMPRTTPPPPTHTTQGGKFKPLTADTKKTVAPKSKTVMPTSLPPPPKLTTPQPPKSEPPVLHWTPKSSNQKPPGKSQGSADSGEDVNVCKDRNCSRTKKRPALESGAIVHVVFGIKGIDKSRVAPGHVLDPSVGEVEFDTKFSDYFSFKEDLSSVIDGIRALCRICRRIANETSLVRDGRAQCFPAHMACLDEIPECRDLQQMSSVYGRQAPAHYMGGLATNHTGLLWWAFAFESTTPKGISYFEAYQQYLMWEDLIEDIKRTEHQYLAVTDAMFQTSPFWTKVLMEVVAVNSAIYGLVLSMVVCLVTVALFTGHVMLLFIVFISILEMICLVVAIFYLAGWEMGAVEAISLSILVGSSVDYCVHLVEGYLLAGEALPDKHKQSASSARRWRTKAAITHIGVSILSSALTTIIAAIPLTQTIIRPFAKFGQIVAINTSVSIVYSLTICPALLSTIAPGLFVPRWRSYVKALAGVVVILATTTLSLYIAAKSGVFIPSPSGEALFSS